MISPKTYFLNADRTKAVEEGDKEARFLLVREGMEISDALAEKYGFNSVNLSPVNVDTKAAKPKNQKK